MNESFQEWLMRRRDQQNEATTNLQQQNQWSQNPNQHQRQIQQNQIRPVAGYDASLFGTCVHSSSQAPAPLIARMDLITSTRHTSSLTPSVPPVASGSLENYISNLSINQEINRLRELSDFQQRQATSIAASTAANSAQRHHSLRYSEAMPASGAIAPNSALVDMYLRQKYPPTGRRNHFLRSVSDGFNEFPSNQSIQRMDTAHLLESQLIREAQSLAAKRQSLSSTTFPTSSRPAIVSATDANIAVGILNTSAVEMPLPPAAASTQPERSQKVRGGVIEPFPERLHRLLREVELSGRTDVISFVSEGRAFAIHKSDVFFKEIVPLYFRQSRLSSFKRQLNLYGFELLNTGPLRGAYFHELFQRDRPEWCRRMRRVAVKVTAARVSISDSSSVDNHEMASKSNEVSKAGDTAFGRVHEPRVEEEEKATSGEGNDEGSSGDEPGEMGSSESFGTKGS